MDDKPANVRQLTDKTARQQEEAAFKSVVNFSERNSLTSAAAAEAGADAKNSQVVISVNTVAHHQIGRLGGQAKKSTLNADDAPSPDIRVGVVGGKSEWEDILQKLFQAGALESVRSLFEQEQEPVSPSTKLTFIGSVKECDAYYAAEKESRKRAPKVQTMEQVLTKLGSAVTTQTRPLRPRN